jgi:hypothetical protein
VVRLPNVEPVVPGDGFQAADSRGNPPSCTSPDDKDIVLDVATWAELDFHKFLDELDPVKPCILLSRGLQSGRCNKIWNVLIGKEPAFSQAFSTFGRVLEDSIV